MENEISILEENSIRSKIHVIRGQQVMLDRDLAELYGVETKVLNQAVKRNKERFPEEFCFQITKEEVEREIISRSQFVTLKNDGDRRGTNIKYLPYVFTEQGVAMLSSVLKSETAIKASIQIMKAFVSMRLFYKIILEYLQNYEQYNSIKLKQMFITKKMIKKFRNSSPSWTNTMSKKPRAYSFRDRFLTLMPNLKVSSQRLKKKLFL